MHNTDSQAWAHRVGYALALVLVTISLFVCAAPARGEPPIQLALMPTPTPAETPTPTVSYDPPRAARPPAAVEATSTATPAPAATPTPGDLKPDVEHSVRPDNLGLLRYTVVEGDTIYDLARTFGLKADSIIWANPEIQSNPAALRVGQELWIPPLDGAVHTVVAGDTLLGIAIAYSVMTEDIEGCFYNDPAAVSRLLVGTKLLIPGAAKGPAQKTAARQIRYAVKPAEGAPVGTGALIWPVSGRISQYYKAGHRAIDVQGWTGLTIVAADTGFVTRAGWDDSGYGNVLVIDHGNGVQTLYAHLYNFAVAAGDSVTQREKIGSMGSTGRSTGPHLHFEVISGGVQENPIDYLPAR